MRRIILILHLFICASISFGQEVQSFAVANALVEKGDYQGAIDNYQSIIASGNISSELYYNLANTYLKIDSVSAAVLYFEKSLRISPHDIDIANNLEIARGRVEDQVTVLSEFFLIIYWRFLYKALTANMWAILSIVFLAGITTFIYMAVYRGVSLRQRKMLTLFSFIFLLFVMSICAGYARKIHDTTNKEAIIFKEIFMKSGPDDRSDDLKLLHSGFKVYIIDTLNGWNKVRTEDREIGWVRPEVYRII